MAIIRTKTRGLSLPSAQGVFDFPAVALTWAFQTFKKWQVRYETRLELARMGSDRLDDIGITEAERQREVAKPFWRA